MTISDPLLTKSSSDSNYPVTQNADLIEIDRVTAEYLRTESIKPGNYEKDDAKKIIDKILKFLMQRLDTQLEKYEIQKLAFFLLGIQGNLIEARTISRQRTQIDSKTTQGTDPIKWYREKSQEISKIAETIRYIYEKSIQISPKGTEIITQENWLSMQALGETILLATLVRNIIYYEIGKYGIRVHDDYSYEIENIDTTDMQNHATNFDLEMLKQGIPSIHLGSEEDYKKLEQKINSSFKDEFGLKFDQYNRILQGCITYQIENDSQTSLVDEKTITDYIHQKFTDIPEDAIIKGLELASLSKANLDGVPIYATDLRTRKMRSLVRPLVMLEIDGKKQYIINSWLTRVSHFRWVHDIDKGYLPFKETEIQSQNLKKDLADLQHKAAKVHEQRIFEIVKNRTNPCDRNIEYDHNCFKNLTGFPGELDVLAFFPTKKQILLIDAKTSQLNLSPLEISSEIKKYTESNDSYEKVILKKKKFLLDNLKDILTCYGINNYDDTWTVECLFVSDSFPFTIPNLTVPLIHVDNLDDFIQK